MTYFALFIKTKGEAEPGDFIAMINYDRSLRSLLKKDHPYIINPEINLNTLSLKKRGRIKVIAKIFRLNNRPVFENEESDQELCHIEEKGYESADIIELFSVLNQYSYIELNEKVFALNSVIEKYQDRLIVYIYKKRIEVEAM